MNKLTKIAATVLGVVATMGVAGVANAALLQIVPGANPAFAEAIGDPGGTAYGNGPNSGAAPGPGLPTALGGWPISANFVPDPSFGGAPGINGWDGSYLNLTQAAPVTFQFMGKGDAGNHDIFQVNTGSGWTTLWDNLSATNGTCGGGGATPSSPNCSTPGSQQTLNFAAGLLLFQYVNLTTGLSAINDGSHNLSPDHAPFPTGPGYFLGVDPYLATGQNDAAGRVVYAGFTDNGFTAAGSGDHDYEDLAVRISTVPEPGSMALLGLGLLAMAGVRRRRS